MQTGCYIVFEGLVGAGKTTQSKRLAESLRQRFPDREILWTREPGGDEVAEAIRALAQGTEFAERMDPICETYLFAAARAQSLRSVVKPAVDRGAIVLSDRSFITSVSFQGFGRGLGLETVLAVNDIAIRECLPDFVVYLDVPIDVAVARTIDKNGDRFESLHRSFYEKAVEGYEAMSKHELLRDRWRAVDANASLDEAYRRIEEVVKPCL